MKKLLYSLIIIGSFGLYAIFQNKLAPKANSLASISAVTPQTSQLSANNLPIQTSITSEPPRNEAGNQTTNQALPSSTSTTAQTSTQPAPIKTTPKSTPVYTPPPTPTPAPTPTPPSQPKGQYNDGQYTGSTADAYYGNIQVQATISGGKITDVVFLQYPSDRSTSRYINGQAMPYLKAEAIAAQNANVDIVSGATDSSMAFQQSLASALAQAKN